MLTSPMNAIHFSHIGLEANDVSVIKSLRKVSSMFSSSFVFYEEDKPSNLDVVLINADDHQALGEWERLKRTHHSVKPLFVSNDDARMSTQQTLKRPFKLRNIADLLYQATLKKSDKQALEAANNEPMQKSEGEQRASDSNSLDILIVDDSKQAQEFIKHTISDTLSDGVRPRYTTADSGEEAITMCLKQSFDLIFLDVEMPGIDGFETCRQLRGQFKSTRIVMLTGKSLSEDYTKGRAAGCNHYLTKPPNASDVKTILTLTHLRKTISS